MAKTLSQLPAIESVEDLLDYLREARNWPIPEDALFDRLSFDWTGDTLRLHEKHAQQLKGGEVQQLQPLIPDQPWGIFIVQFNEPEIYRTALRQVLRGLVPSRRRDASLKSWHHTNLLFICFTSDFERITFAHFRGDKHDRAKLATFGWEKGKAYGRTLLEHNLPKLNWPEDESNHAAWTKDWAKAFDKEPLTKEFFKRFQAVLEAIKTDLEKNHKFTSAQAYSRSQLLLERLLFLYFLQNRGWLNQQRNYLLDNFKPHEDRQSEFTYYHEFLEHLFWTLASAPRTEGKTRLPGIPFLNGGLFDDDEFAPTDLRKKSHPPLKIRNATFAYVFEHLLEAFNFTVREDTPLNQDVAVDPEMLGKVFESIVLHAEAADPDAVAPDKRKATGSYYTPRIVVHFICRESLCQYLVGHLPEGRDWNRRLRDLMEITPIDHLEADQIAQLKDLVTASEGKQLLDMIVGLKCLDPSVGSGAFPVGLLHELVNLRRLFECAANGYVDPVRGPGNQWVHKSKAEIVENCLYGVDLQQQAIEICRLRLWLSLVVDYDIGLDPFNAEASQFKDAINRISQLPNLEMNFRRGDSLLDMVADVPIRIDSALVSGQMDIVNKIKALGHDLHKATKATRKKNLRLDILARRLELSERVLTNLQRKLIGEDAAITSTLFGDLSPKEKARRADIALELPQIKKALEKIVKERTERDRLAADVEAADFYPRLRRLEGADFDSPFNFVWQIDFSNIFVGNQQLGSSALHKSGFDLLVGNPPFVTVRNPTKRELYRSRWKSVCQGEYELVCPFFERSFGLLKHGGLLGFIVSNGFMMREFGKPLIEDFFSSIDLRKVMDCSGLLFPGHGTPTCLIFGANRKPNPKQPILVSAVLPGGGDLKTVPEDSPLWHDLATHHENTGYMNSRITVDSRIPSVFCQWPLKLEASGDKTKQVLEERSSPLGELISSCGCMFDTHKDDAFLLTSDVLRRHCFEDGSFLQFTPGDEIRNWQLFDGRFVIRPYDQKWKLLTENRSLNQFKWLRKLKHDLEGRATFSGKTYAEAKEPWYRYHQMSIAKITAPLTVVYPEIATHCHFVPLERGRLCPQTAPVLELATCNEQSACILSGLLNSSSALFWMKQVSFNKGAGKDEQLDRFEYQGKRVKQIPIPSTVEHALFGEMQLVASQLLTLSNSCWKRGETFPSLAMRKLFEKSGEAYHAWSAALPGYVKRHKDIGSTFATTDNLRAALGLTCSFRDILKRQMIALQEEMDWAVYVAYGLLDNESKAWNPKWVGNLVADPKAESPVPQLREEERAFRLWAKAEGDFAKAVAIIPEDWSAELRALWEARLAAIRDNEHIRRIEAPVYKRRWDEQWKVGNRWMAGPVAYAQELVDAFTWWLSEKAEWHLEHKAKGGPLALDAWTHALWSDSRVQAAWPVVADAINEVALWKIDNSGKTPAKPPKPDPSSTAFAKFLKATVNDETVPDGIPPAVPWEELEKRMTVPKQAIKVRGKLNVPRERFRVRKDGSYVWAGNS